MICALCKVEKGKLINSHLLPAAAYVHVRGNGAIGNSSPVQIQFDEKSAFSTDKQIKQPLLCSECENLFSKNGERRMGSLWATKNSFPLLDILIARAFLGRGEKFAMYDSRALPTEVVSSVFYFVVSVFWRAQVWDWGSKTTHKASVDADLLERFRLFLLGMCDLDDVFILVNLNEHSDTRAMMSLPTCSVVEGDTVYSFSLLGLKISMYAGDKVSNTAKAPFQAHGVRLMFISSDISKTPYFQRLAERVQMGVKSRGSLAKSSNK
jgi:hypothetical protein